MYISCAAKYRTYPMRSSNPDPEAHRAGVQMQYIEPGRQLGEVTAATACGKKSHRDNFIASFLFPLPPF